jgi:hypothetical protein
MGWVSTTADAHSITLAGPGFAWQAHPLNRRNGNGTFAPLHER